jgi:hypothetical protein
MQRFWVVRAAHADRFLVSLSGRTWSDDECAALRFASQDAADLVVGVIGGGLAVEVIAPLEA